MGQDRRQINDNRWRVFGGGDPHKVVAFVCECGDPTCHSTAMLTVGEYERRRANDSAPIVYPGHLGVRGQDDVSVLAG